MNTAFGDGSSATRRSALKDLCVWVAGTSPTMTSRKKRRFISIQIRHIEIRLHFRSSLDISIVPRQRRGLIVMHRHHHFHGGRDEHRGRHPWAGHMGGRGAHGRHRGGRIGRFLEHGDPRFVVLALLAEQARHGYELIKELEDRTGGAYRPSPGVIYPTFARLSEEGFIRPVTGEAG